MTQTILTVLKLLVRASRMPARIVTIALVVAAITALLSVPKTTGGVQVALTVMGTVLPFLILYSESSRRDDTSPSPSIPDLQMLELQSSAADRPKLEIKAKPRKSGQKKRSASRERLVT